MYDGYSVYIVITGAETQFSGEFSMLPAATAVLTRSDQETGGKSLGLWKHPKNTSSFSELWPLEC